MDTAAPVQLPSASCGTSIVIQGGTTVSSRKAKRYAIKKARLKRRRQAAAILRSERQVARECDADLIRQQTIVRRVLWSHRLHTCSICFVSEK